MVIVALETVTREGSLALWQNGRCESWVGDATRTHGARLPGELVDGLAHRGLEVGDVDLFAVVSGPGSFTGLRVGVAAVQGLTLATSRPAIGIPTLDALATAWRLAAPAPARIVACLDGQRGEVFFEVFDVVESDADLDSVPRLVPASVGTPQELVSVLTALPERAPLVVVGDGAARYADQLTAGLPTATIVREPRRLAEAAAVLAAAHPDRAAAPHALQPVYIRKPDAELGRARRSRAASDGHEIPIVIRRAESPADLEAVQILQERSFANPWRADAFQWELEHSKVARLYLAATAEGAVVAYCACWVVADELHINNVAVDPAYRRRRIASRLLNQVVRESVGQGVRGVTLEVRESNEAARKLYEGLGFKVEATRKDYYQDPREHALILWHRTPS